MAELKHQPDQAWERFFEFIFPCEIDCESKLSREEVQSDLKRLGIDVRKAVNRVKQAVLSARGKAELTKARVNRLSAISRMEQVVVPSASNLRTRLKDIIAGRLESSVQAAYFRRLEAAATDEDLQSLLDDIHRLEAMSEGQEGGNLPTE